MVKNLYLAIRRKSKKIRKPLKPFFTESVGAVAFFVVCSVIYLIHLSCRKRYINKSVEDRLIEENKRIIYAVYHSFLNYGLYFFRKRNATLMLSSGDIGTAASFVMKHIVNLEIAWGSSSRGGKEAKQAMIATISKGRQGVMTIDGPSGPIHKVKPGIVRIASQTRAYILPVIAKPNKGVRLGFIWDKPIVPYPFTRESFVFGEPIFVPEGISDDAFDEYRLRLEKTMYSLHQQILSNPISISNPRPQGNEKR